MDIVCFDDMFVLQGWHFFENVSAIERKKMQCKFNTEALDCGNFMK